MLMSLLTQWFDREKRDLPWRRSDCGAWGVLVSEIMLQQTPVSRVVPAFEAWIKRWPTPSDLATDSAAEAVRMWDRLGYPRRARRLHQTATIITEQHQGVVPHDLDALLALPGVGDYTARAVRCFAFGIPEPVVDTNVRRVVARLVVGEGQAGPPRIVPDRLATDTLLTTLDGDAQRCTGAAALMELGAVVCTATKPACDRCPVAAACAWKNAGYPSYQGPLPSKQGTYQGSDRQVRGIILGELRHSDIPIPRSFFDSLWPDQKQLHRAFSSLTDDGLVEESDEAPGHYHLATR
jgi:A/G-specific adenine glycosylase